MPILDLHSSVDATGSTDAFVSENTTGTIPANDGASVAGISPWPNATLIAYGAHVGAAAQAIVGIGLTSNNLVDPTNKLQDNATGTDTRTMAIKTVQIGYANGANLVQYSQEAAGLIAAFKLDYLSGVGTSGPGSLFPTGPAEYSVTFGAATAQVYKTLAFAPTNPIPIGTYDILGFRTSASTFGGVLRFQHTDFGGAFPGMPFVGYSDAALTGANQGGNLFTSDSWQGTQFAQLSIALGRPVCPRFRVQGQGTGLVIQLLDNIADTVTVALNLQKVA